MSKSLKFTNLGDDWEATAKVVKHMESYRTKDIEDLSIPTMEEIEAEMEDTNYQQFMDRLDSEIIEDQELKFDFGDR